MQSCVWKDKLFTGKKNDVVISQFKLGSGRQVHEYATIKWRTRQAWNGDRQEMFVSEGYLVRLFMASCADAREENVRLDAFTFDAMITPKRALPLAFDDGESPFHLAQEVSGNLKGRL